MSEKDFSEINKIVEKQDTSEMEGKYLTFWIDKQLFGIPIADVVQIVQMQPITSIPEFPFYAKGIISLRGSITPLIDVRLRLGREEIEYNDRTCIIVTSISDKLYGFIVDGVNEVTTILDEQFSPPPQMDNESETRYVSGVARVADKIMLAVDATLLLGNNTLPL